MILVYLLVLAVVVGYLRGGRLNGYLQKPLKGIILPVAGFLIEGSLAWLPGVLLAPPLRWLWVVVAAEYLCLFTFLFLNRDERAFWLVALGTATNFAAMAFHQFRMPVSPVIFDFSSLAAFVERVRSGELVEYVLVGWNAPLWWLGDCIPVPWLVPGVASVGDFLMGAGLFWWVQRMMMRKQ
ncbi:MAG: DUF5317 family protein [Eubacteriales bacterium]|nr:DUF5317 family protein [Eubacteriales bacterium]